MRVRCAPICLGLILLMSVYPCAWADEAADQLERARLLRDLAETRPDLQPDPGVARLPGASIEAERAPSRDTVRRQQFEDSQWRQLLGNQQMQIHTPPTQEIPQSQWRSQTFERDRAAEELSADILRRNREYLSNSHR